MEEDSIDLYDYNDHNKTIFYNETRYDDCYNKVVELLDNFYDNILDRMKVVDNLEIYEIIILDIDNYLDFIEDILINYRSYHIFRDTDYEPIPTFNQEIYNNKYFNSIKDRIDNKLGYLINANKFDLI
jgi:hypothetical protein